MSRWPWWRSATTSRLLQEAEYTLRRDRDLIAFVVDGSADPIFAKDTGGHFVILSRPAAALLGVPLEAASGRRAAERLPPAAAAAWRRWTKR